MLEQVRGSIREVPDFPKPGILFKDISPTIKDPKLFGFVVNEMAKRHGQLGITRIAAIESRGFIFGSALAHRMGLGLSLLRKPNKLPFHRNRVEYDLEYGTDALEAHIDGMDAGDSVLLVDDVLATGGTALAGAKLIEKCSAIVTGMCFFIELDALKGRDRLRPYKVDALLSL